MRNLLVITTGLVFLLLSSCKPSFQKPNPEPPETYEPGHVRIVISCQNELIISIENTTNREIPGEELHIILNCGLTPFNDYDVSSPIPAISPYSQEVYTVNLPNCCEVDQYGVEVCSTVFWIVTYGESYIRYGSCFVIDFDEYAKTAEDK